MVAAVEDAMTGLCSQTGPGLQEHLPSPEMTPEASAVPLDHLDLIAPAHPHWFARAANEGVSGHAGADGVAHDYGTASYVADEQLQRSHSTDSTPLMPAFELADPQGRSLLGVEHADRPLAYGVQILVRTSENRALVLADTQTAAKKTFAMEYLADAC